MIDHPRLERLLGGEDLAWLVGRIRKRMERCESLDTSVTRTDATAAERAAVQRLLGRPPLPGRAVTVSLPAVRRLLRDSGACPDGLEAAIIALTGDVVDRRAAAAELAQSWQQAFEPLNMVVEQKPELEEWLSELSRSGLVRRLAATPQQAHALLRGLAAIIHELPAHGEPLGRFAAQGERNGDARSGRRSAFSVTSCRPPCSPSGCRGTPDPRPGGLWELFVKPANRRY